MLFGNGGIHCVSRDGESLWEHPLGEAQHVVAGRFRTDSPPQFTDRFGWLAGGILVSEPGFGP